MMRTNFLIAITVSLLALQLSGTARAQTSSSSSASSGAYSEDFTGAATSHLWNFFNGACLTAGSGTSTTSPGYVPACTTIGSSYYGQNLVGGQNGASGSAQTVPDPAGHGALRFTNGNPGGYNQNGAIVSSDTLGTSQGLQITFKTVTYRGDSGGAGGDGADGISFYLMDGSKPPGIGAWGGSLAYSCSNTNPPYNGLSFGYVGLGIDEYGNFLNGSSLMSGYTGTNSATGDNAALGYGYKPGRIGLRGAGNVSWTSLTAAYGTNPHSSSHPYYPASLATTCNNGTYNSSSGSCNTTGAVTYSQLAVQKTCQTGTLWNYVTPGSPTSAGAATLANSVNTANILDYAPIPNAYQELPSTLKIANESAMKRGDATPIFYRLKITQDGLLSLSYSFSGSAYQPVISNQDITAANGPLPSSFRFGFAGSTGGSTNIHEIMCFKAQPSNASGSSTTVNEKQAAKVEAGTQAYFAFYNPNDWAGRLTANNLVDNAGTVTVSSTANWDGSCVLTGVASGQTCTATNVTGPTAAEAPGNRVMLTWNGSTGVPFEWSNFTSTMQTTLDAGDPAPINANRLNYLRGDRSNELNSAGVGLYNQRDSVLGDIIDSSPTWVGPPISPYTATWKDRLYSGAAAPEGSSYAAYVAAKQTRLNVVYAGANDGFLHGFRAGSFDAAGNFVNNATTPNDGKEVLAYMPAAITKTIHSTTANIDFSNPQYGHNFDVDATPGDGDLYYGGAWHTWLVGGLGIGGADIYALDVSDPRSSTFAESNSANVVIGDWTPATLSCSGASTCGTNLGNTFGTPQIRRLHNGNWGVIFGNGFGSSTGDAGIYVMSISQTSGAPTFYYLSTGQAGSNGIAYATPADLDGDHITDYVYAGDLLGNVWRFDLTDSNPVNWTSSRLFTTNTGQPITSQLLVASTLASGGAPQVMVEFGTGQRTQLTNTLPVSYASGTQDIYAVWDWNMTAWNARSAAQYASLTAASSGLSSANNYLVSQSKLQAQTLTATTPTVREETTINAVCYQGYTLCASNNNKFGWYANLPGGSEQIIFNPVFFQGAFIVNSTVPANNIPTSCAVTSDTGFTYVLAVSTGSIIPNVFPSYLDATAAGVETDATGSPYIVTTAENTTNLIYQTVSGAPGSQLVNIPSNIKTKRLTWVQRR